ncbi:hypothetical protein [Saccharothrix syringae]|uniref:hypothetical protein n=1 Tax=Saccharothrix syringae TaxID=103733 RepID=UPI000A470A59|nr:hypothetical protein [Saccharothrix syringae]
MPGPSPTSWRRLDPGQQALLVPVYPCKGETFAKICTGSPPTAPPAQGKHRMHG